MPSSISIEVKVKFEKPKKTVPTALESKNAQPIDLQQKKTEADIFGRNTGVSSVSKLKKGKYHINLNPETAFGPEVIKSFDFPQTTLKELTKHMQKLTGINLIVDDEIKGNISITAPSPITVGDAWKAYLTALNINGYSLVKSGAFYKIVKTREIRYVPTEIYTGSYSPQY